jgi:hypothetical protein
MTAAASAASYGTASQQQLPAVGLQLLRQLLLQQLKQLHTNQEWHSWPHCTVQLQQQLLLVLHGAISGWRGSCRRVQLCIAVEVSFAAASPTQNNDYQTIWLCK